MIFRTFEIFNFDATKLHRISTATKIQNFRGVGDGP